MLDTTPGTNISEDDANVANGWSAMGSDEIKALDVTGPTSGTWRTTYNSGSTTNFSYDWLNGTTSDNNQIVTFLSADFDILTEDANGDRVTITKSGVLMQDTNGNVFIRPSNDSVAEWNDFTIVYRITVKNVAPIANSTTMAKVGFRPEIKNLNIPPPCFAAGTLIETDRGEVAVEDLRRGDRVWTRDGGFQAITWAGGRRLDALALAAWPRLRPIRISAGALGAGTPARDLMVSPQHRILVRSKIAGRMFGEDEVLVAARHLVGLPGIAVAEDMTEVHYVHILLGAHAVVRSNGAETESLFPGAEAMKGVAPEARAEIVMLFPELAASAAPEPARPLPKGSQARKLAERHAQNGHELVS